MPKSCNSILNKIYLLAIVVFISSCASTKKDNPAQFNGKIMISQDNNKLSTFNIVLNINKKESIIQIKKPFYGNVLKIELKKGKNTLFIPSEMSEPFYIPELIERNFKFWLNQCIYSNEFFVYEPIEQSNFIFDCKKNRNKTNFTIKYYDFNLEGFLI